MISKNSSGSVEDAGVSIKVPGSISSEFLDIFLCTFYRMVTTLLVYLNPRFYTCLIFAL